MSNESQPLNAAAETSVDHSTLDMKAETEMTPCVRKEISRMFHLAWPVVRVPRKMDKLGIYFQSGLIVLGVALVPISLLSWHAESVLLFFGQDPAISMYAGQFSRVTIFGIPFLFVYELIKKLQQSQNIVLPMMYVACVGVVVNVVTGFCLTYYTSWVFLGAAVGRVCGSVALPLTIVAYFHYDHATTSTWWRGFQWRDACSHVGLFLSLGVPSMTMLAVSWWAFCALGFLAGILPNSVHAVSVNAVLGQLLTLNFMIYLGISVASNVLIGNALGANQPQRARLIARLGLTAGGISAAIMASLFLVGRHAIPYLFVSDPLTIEYGRLLGATIVINILSYYAFGLPMAYYVGITCGYDLEGVWLGFSLGTTACFGIFIAMIQSTDWPALAKLALDRVQL
ncbi:hypothetical protein DYB37_010620 [Aphanomyces astaci]|uniref:Polysaccharide biosynthesis protein C-terminal domain-containing protein n=1 Tax=Aphanomyces astaci TaxID=112090 RepID=A0A3R6WZX6_APHAT|nr:hypothetical protein DYB35_009806 [Aphanomyces astaci]RHZ04780.1 hypothetical protein DYB37_010620 [Aphanomyces astaci]